MELLATMATVYSAGFAVSAATWMFLCSVVLLDVTVTVPLAHSAAVSFTMRRAAKSFDRMRTEPEAMPQSANTGVAVRARAETSPKLKFLIRFPFPLGMSRLDVAFGLQSNARREAYRAIRRKR